LEQAIWFLNRVVNMLQSYVEKHRKTMMHLTAVKWSFGEAAESSRAQQA